MEMGEEWGFLQSIPAVRAARINGSVKAVLLMEMDAICQSSRRSSPVPSRAFDLAGIKLSARLLA
jgi:hypothetical protein